MEGLLPLAVLIGASGSLLFMKRHTQGSEGFQNGVNPAVTTALGQDHTRYIGDMASRVNPIMNLINPAANPLLPNKFKSSDVRSAEANLQDALRTVDADPKNPSMKLTSSDVSKFRLNAAGGGTGGFKSIGVCEAIQTIDCNAFDKPNFNANCGICHEGGVDSGNNKKTGGLYITEEDKFNAEADMRRMQGRRAKFSPSVGRCAPGRFTTTKAQCIRMKQQMECEKKQDFTSDGCRQCYQDETFKYVTTDVDTTDPSLIISGTGTLRITLIGKKQPNAFTTPIELSSTAVTLSLPDFEEGDSLQLSLTPETANIGGYFTGKTPTGEFRLDITRLIQTDTITGAKPRLAGQQDVNGDMYMTIRPGRGKESMNLILQNVFTFVDTTEEESFQCASAPFITKASSAAFLNSGPCYKKGQGPGKYSNECLQTIFTSAGCDVKGEGYPSTQAKAKQLMNQGGQALKIGQIAGQVYQDSLSAYSGRTAAGEKLGLNAWDEVSRKCTGKQILSPCDLDDKANGPLSSECMTYLWQNLGANDKRPGATGPTYSNTAATTSLSGTKNQFCTPNGTMAPVNAQGKVNQQAYQQALKQGGVQKVKDFYDTIHKRANDNRLKDSERQAAIQQCYGVNLQTIAANSSESLPVNVKDTTCVPTTLVASYANVANAVNRGTIQIKSNWTWTISIKPTGLVNNWASVFLATRTGNDGLKFGDRCPGLWFHPNTTRLHISMIGSDNQNRSLDSGLNLPLNKVTNVTINYLDGILSYKCTGALTDEKQMTIPTAGIGYATVFAPMSGYTMIKGEVSNLSFCSYDSLQSTLTNAPGRTKTAFKQENYPPMDWSKWSRSVNVIGSYRMAPWNGTWNGLASFPDDGTAKWIWTRAGAARDDPTRNEKPFVKRYVNPTNQIIPAILYACVDNVASMWINDQIIAPRWEGFGRWSIQLPPGESKIHINAANQGGPAGLIVICKDGKNKTLFVSDSSWVTRNDIT
jgi:hypothetical protein